MSHFALFLHLLAINLNCYQHHFPLPVAVVWLALLSGSVSSILLGLIIPCGFILLLRIISSYGTILFGLSCLAWTIIWLWLSCCKQYWTNSWVILHSLQLKSSTKCFDLSRKFVKIIENDDSYFVEINLFDGIVSWSHESMRLLPNFKPIRWWGEWWF